MKIPRVWLLAAALITAAGIAYYARDLAYDAIVLPLAYLAWQLRGLLAGVAQLIQWVVLVALLAVAMAWQLIPELKRPPRRFRALSLPVGQVHVTAVALHRARLSNYFRWQVAHRLGRALSQLQDLSGVVARPAPDADPVAAYMDAGLNHSFVEYSAPRGLRRGHDAGPLSLAPEDAVDYLESLVLRGGGEYVRNR